MQIDPVRAIWHYCKAQLYQWFRKNSTLYISQKQQWATLFYQQVIEKEEKKQN